MTKFFERSFGLGRAAIAAVMLCGTLFFSQSPVSINARPHREAPKTEDAGLPQIAYFNPESMRWYRRGQDEDSALDVMKWGEPGDIPVPGDYDGDGREDNAVWRSANSTMYIHRSSDDRLMGIPLYSPTQRTHSRALNIPVAGDFDGDRISDIAVWRPDNGYWYILLSSNDFDPEKRKIIALGANGDIPVPADYDGDGKTDAAVYRPSEGRWYITESKSGRNVNYKFGEPGDILVPADYTGDGRADLAVYRKDTWHVRDSRTGQIVPFYFGFEDAIPIPADYDGDGVADFAFFRNGLWYLTESKTGNLRTLDFGRTGDIPLPALNTRKTSN